jgi:hypothetical protein
MLVRIGCADHYPNDALSKKLVLAVCRALTLNALEWRCGDTIDEWLMCYGKKSLTIPSLTLARS